MEEIDRRKFIKTTVLTGLVGSASIPLLGKIPIVKEKSTLRFYNPDSKEIDWLKVRESFPLRKEVHYFNTASLGPSPMLLIDNLRLNTLNFETRAATGRQHFKNVRVQMAQYLFCDPDEIAFTRNVTEGINIAARSLDLKEGDEVVITDNEHVGGILPWMAIAKETGVIIKVIDLDVTGENVVSQFEEAITPKTKVVFFSHVLCTTGMVLPAKEIASLCKSKGVVSCVDGAQALGMISVDLRDIDSDFYFGCGHKWLLGLEGTGVLFINKKTIEKVNPFYAGAYTSESFDLKSNQLEYRNVAEREEYGTRNVPLIMSISDSLDFMGEIGYENIFKRHVELSDYLRSGLESMKDISILTPESPQYKGGILTIKVEGHDFNQVRRILMTDYKCQVRAIYENNINGLRISTSIYNSKKEIETLVEALKKITL